MATSTYTIEMASVDAQSELRSEYKAVFQLPDSEIDAAMAALDKKRGALAADKMDKRETARKASAQKAEAARDTVRGQIKDALGKSWTQPLQDAFLKLARADLSVKKLSFVVEVQQDTVKDSDGNVTVTVKGLVEPTVVLGTHVASRGPSTNGGSQSITVDGEQFASAAAAYRKHIGEMASPKNRATVMKALQDAGHTVS